MKTLAWDIWLYCNYDCKFCNTKTNIFPEKIHSVEEIFNSWENIYEKYGKCKICITGGEPLLYPQIDSVIEKLSTLHYLHITTNLSMDVDFLFKINIDKKNIFFNITFHPFYTNINELVFKLLNLKKYGYKFSVCYMNDNFQLFEFLNYKKFLNKYKIELSLSSNTNSNIQPKILNNFVDNNSISLYNNKCMNLATKNKCNAGINYACIDSLGDVYSCSINKIKMGNIFNNTFCFLDKNIDCYKECKLLENKY